jgi:hypothetical protein
MFDQNRTPAHNKKIPERRTKIVKLEQFKTIDHGISVPKFEQNLFLLLLFIFVHKTKVKFVND